MKRVQILNAQGGKGIRLTVTDPVAYAFVEALERSHKHPLFKQPTTSFTINTASGSKVFVSLSEVAAVVVEEELPEE